MSDRPSYVTTSLAGYSHTHRSDGSPLVKVVFKKELFQKQPASLNASQTGELSRLHLIPIPSHVDERDQANADAHPSESRLFAGNPSVGLIVYKNMDRILPLTFADDRTFRRPEK